MTNSPEVHSGELFCRKEKYCIFLDLWYNKQKYVMPVCDDNLGGIPMAESKQYITQLQDNGSVLISEDVIAAIVAHAAGEVEGVVSLNTKPGADIAELIGKKNWGRGLKITILEDNSVSIDCNVTVSYGQSVVVVAEAVQTAVTNALETMAGIKIAAVNVNICGIVRQ